MNITRMGIDLAKNVFEVHGVDRNGKAVLHKQLTRRKMKEFFVTLPPCLIGMEACGTGHYWARELTRLGHEVKLMAPQFVSPYRKNEKNDQNDAEAICEAVSRPNMRFVSIKTADQQAALTVHRARQLLVAERTALMNQIRGLLQEFGIAISQGVSHLRKALPEVLADESLPGMARETFHELHERLMDLEKRVSGYDRRIGSIAKQMPAAERLMEVGGVGVITATALIATVGDPKIFKNGRQFAAWLGLVPRQYSSGGKTRLGRITKRGDVYLRTMLVHGARAALRTSAGKTDPRSVWIQSVKERRGQNKAAVALAAKNARILWALLARDQRYEVNRAA